AHASLYEWDVADREFQRALALNPHDALAHNWYGLFLSGLTRHEEAIAHSKRAVELDPLNLKCADNLAIAYSNAGLNDLAVDEFKKVIEMDPNFGSAHGNLAFTYFDLGKYDLWLEEWKKAATLNNEQDLLATLNEVAQVYDRSGLQPALRRA